jgi:hypothetical protein
MFGAKVRGRGKDIEVSDSDRRVHAVIERLDETVSFTERRVERVEGDLREVSDQVYRLGERLARLERRVAEVIERLPPPPVDGQDEPGDTHDDDSGAGPEPTYG